MPCLYECSTHGLNTHVVLIYPPLSSVKSENGARSLKKLERLKLGSRKSSGTIIVPHDSPYVEIHDEKYDDGDARTMSPRRGSEETEQMGEEARQALVKFVKRSLKFGNCLESLKSEHEKLEDGNRFLQACVGELMQTSKSPPPAPRKAL
ncbi:hypothetical protein DM02DRAFT_707031 [Periconia macrospinosa]|uniref:Uncharacterized protein n=1 Tax=Periconia macrospinosa TaxID=97972 RepID=A0A2V1CZ72_9PLEO|nr:hypothetical protein DM02DRAFT_707031 [Periconia macrospinosa]